MNLKSPCKYLVFGAAALLFGCSAVSGGREAVNPDVRVEVANQESLTLLVSVRSRADTPVTVDKHVLPWGNNNSLMLEAVTGGDHFVTRYFPIDDPGVQQATLNPNQWVSGDINLREYFGGLDTAVKKSDVRLFWAYRSPAELKIAQWTRGSVIIDQQK